MTDVQIAEFFGVEERTITRWKQEYPAFCLSLNDGKVIADAEVASSLYQRATGEVTFYEKSIKKGDEYEVIKLHQRQPADPGAAKLWLTNRQGKLWRDKVVNEFSGIDGAPIQTEEVSARERIAGRITGLAARARTPE